MVQQLKYTHQPWSLRPYVRQFPVPNTLNNNYLLSRTDLHSNVTCEASNYNGSVMQKTITLDMNFLPTRISVSEKKTPLLAGTPQTYTCSALGSRPPATITWWLDHKRIDGGQKLFCFDLYIFPGLN